MSSKEKLFNNLVEAVLTFDEKIIVEKTKEALSSGVDPLDIIEKGLAKGLKAVGEKYEAGEFFLMHLIAAAEPVQSVIKELLEPEIRKKGGGRKPLGKVVLGTVEGDIHDIGKNIVGAMLTAANFEVYDIGKDVPAEKFVEKAKEIQADIIGASALLTTTLPGQERIIEILKREGIRDRFKVILGGAPVTEEWVKKVGGDGYAGDAVEAVKLVKRLLGEGE
ncbi:MAG: B12-binding domain-containing protein [Candidatus Bathyarchaeia archaeon]|nr:B12-binding domain-containing protein [Candidatus Bathyarchaeota archaeon]